MDSYCLGIASKCPVYSEVLLYIRRFYFLKLHPAPFLKAHFICTSYMKCIPYRIVSESSDAPRSRRSLLAVNEFNQTTITLEFGNPPAPNITTTTPPTIAMEIMMAGELNDSVDLDVCI